MQPSRAMKDIKFIVVMVLAAGTLVLMGSSVTERKGNILSRADKAGSVDTTCPWIPTNCPSR